MLNFYEFSNLLEGLREKLIAKGFDLADAPTKPAAIAPGKSPLPTKPLPTPPATKLPEPEPEEDIPDDIIPSAKPQVTPTKSKISAKPDDGLFANAPTSYNKGDTILQNNPAGGIGGTREAPSKQLDRAFRKQYGSDYERETPSIGFTPDTGPDVPLARPEDRKDLKLPTPEMEKSVGPETLISPRYRTTLDKTGVDPKPGIGPSLPRTKPTDIDNDAKAQGALNTLIGILDGLKHTGNLPKGISKQQLRKAIELQMGQLDGKNLHRLMRAAKDVEADLEEAAQWMDYFDLMESYHPSIMR